jgi:hypothetical protein
MKYSNFSIYKNGTIPVSGTANGNVLLLWNQYNSNL